MADRAQEIARAREAQRLLHDPLYQAAWAALLRRAEEELLEGPDDPEALLRARCERRWLQELRAHFERHVTTGRLAERSTA